MQEIKFIKTEENKAKGPITNTFGKQTTNYMFQMDYNPEQGWHNATIKPYERLDLSPFTSCLHYGQTIFEGLKAIKKDGKRILFRPDANFIRMNESAKRMAMPEIDVEFVSHALVELLKLEPDEWFGTDDNPKALYIRPTMIASEDMLDAKISQEYTFFIVLTPITSYFKDAKVNLVTEVDHSRSAEGGTGETKNGGNYGGAFNATARAMAKGYSQVLWLDSNEKKYVEEAGMMNVFFVIDNELVTPATNRGTLLKGITRNSVLTIAKDLGLNAKEETIDINDIIKLYKEGRVSEIFASGTAASIQAIHSLTHDGFKMEFDSQEISDKIKQHLEDIKTGKVEDKYNYVITY